MLDTAEPLALIGDTPLIELTSLDFGPCRVFAKLESQNPTGSIKDRIAMSMVDAAERSGALKPGGRLIEATAGNTGLALALVAARRGYHLTLVIPDKMSREKIAHLRAMGAEVVLTRSDVPKGHPEYYQDLAECIGKETGAFYTDQFNNPNNPAAHERSTGPEIWEQMEGKVDAIVAGVGSGGTMTGLSRYFARVSPATELVLADPKGSCLRTISIPARSARPEAGSSKASARISSLRSAIFPVSRRPTPSRMAKVSPRPVTVLRKEGLLAGSSSGTLIAAAQRYCLEQTEPKRVVTFICDSGNKYLSKMYDDRWMVEQGLLQRPGHGDLRDLIARRFDEGAVVTVGADDTLQTAYGRMKLYDVSQVPVLDSDRCVGLLDEFDLLVALTQGTLDFKLPVKQAMAAKVETVSPDTPPENLLPLFNRGMVAVVVDGEHFLGLITRIDLLNHLRRKLD